MDYLISVIVPAYNIEQYIGRCLESICQQTYKALEIIVVNDGSTDTTGQIIDRYAVDDLRIISIHKENGGVSSARIAGIERATGDYIGFVDGDDYIEPEMYSELLKNALNFQAEISHCGNKMIFPDKHEELHYGTDRLIVQSQQDALVELLKGVCVEPGLGNKLFHRSIVATYKKSNMWDSSIRINEDLLMNYIFFKQADKIVFEDKTFYHYILRKNSATTSKKERFHLMDPLNVIQLIRQDCAQDENLYPIVYERYLRALINITVQHEWKNEAKTAKEELRKEISKRTLFEYCNSNKVKLMVIGVSWLEPIYKIIRKIYDMITGVSKKYEIT